MTKTRVILVIGFLVALGAGMAVGAALKRGGEPKPRKPWIEEELNLTPEQREKMHDIWSESMREMREYQRDRRQALLSERDEAIQNLLSVPQRAEYAEIQRIYERESAALSEAARKAFDEAKEKTKEILTEEQQEAYDRMLRERAGRRRHGSRRGRGSDRDGADAPPEPGEPPPVPPPPPQF